MNPKFNLTFNDSIKVACVERTGKGLLVGHYNATNECVEIHFQPNELDDELDDE